MLFTQHNPAVRRCPGENYSGVPLVFEAPGPTVRISAKQQEIAWTDVGSNPVFVLQHDLNGDGKRDLVVVNEGSDDISVLLGNGDGTFKPQKRFAAGTHPVWAVTGDFNRDGKMPAPPESPSCLAMAMEHFSLSTPSQPTAPSLRLQKRHCGRMASSTSWALIPFRESL